MYNIRVKVECNISMGCGLEPSSGRLHNVSAMEMLKKALKEKKGIG